MYVPGAIEEAGEEWGVSQSMIVLIGMLVLAAGLETAIFILPQPAIARFRRAAVCQPIYSPCDRLARLGARAK